MLSEYEKTRERNIERNNSILVGLGLLDASPKPTPQRRPAKRKARAANAVPIRQSHRQRGEDSSGRPVSRSRPSRNSASIAVVDGGSASLTPTWETWAAQLFKSNMLVKSGKAHVEWGQHHQHLTLSSDRSIVANTGCAGYGGVVMHTKKQKVEGTRQSAPKVLVWRVKVLQLGVGGFAVGVGASSGLKKPFKSFGNHPHAWTFHSEGHTSHNRAQSKYADEGYGEDDIISIVLKPQTPKANQERPKAIQSATKKITRKKVCNEVWDLHFEVNGKSPGRAFRGLVFSTGVPVLICQPYMQGAGQLI
jgi:hypothetical protein